jgi:tetratricopeptide (TPR) repeat protein
MINKKKKTEEEMLRRSIRPLQFKRSFHKIEVSNPLGIFLLNQSRAVLKGIGIFYAGALIAGVGVYFGSKQYIDKYQTMGQDWSIYTKCLGRLGVYFQMIKDDDANAEMSLIYCLKNIAETEGIHVEDEDPRKFQLLNLEQLSSKSKNFKEKYLDLVMRLAISKGELGDLTNCWKLTQYALNLPMDVGSVDLKSQILRLSAKLESQKEHYANAESYLLDAIKFNEYHEDDINFVEHGSLTLSKESKITKELFKSLLDLGVLYTKMNQQSKSLEIFLNLLQLTETPYEGFEHVNRALLKNYIGEILYSKGLTDKAIEWCRDAFKEARIEAKFDPLSAVITKQSLRDLVTLYRKKDELELAKQAQDQLDQCEIPVKVNREWALLEKMLS